MIKVISEFNVGEYKVLKLNENKPNKKYTKYIIDGKEFEIVPIYDAINCIAIKSSDSFIGKTIQFK